MELRAKVLYDCPQFTLYEGQSTADLGVEVSEAKKLQMMTDFPDWFEVIDSPAKKEEHLKIEVPEDKLKIRKK